MKCTQANCHHPALFLCDACGDERCIAHLKMCEDCGKPHCHSIDSLCHAAHECPKTPYSTIPDCGDGRGEVMMHPPSAAAVRCLMRPLRT
jgi:hypothetical protein